MPEKITDSIMYVPERAGVLCISKSKHGVGNEVVLLRAPQTNKEARALNEYEKYKLARLGALRIYSLKSRVKTSRELNAALREEIKKYKEALSACDMPACKPEMHAIEV
jgi:hypothetical protein